MRNKGITLVALVITIIVLLILSGVTISALSGENGIITNAIKAKKIDRYTWQMQTKRNQESQY